MKSIPFQDLKVGDIFITKVPGPECTASGKVIKIDVSSNHLLYEPTFLDEQYSEEKEINHWVFSPNDKFQILEKEDFDLMNIGK